LRRLIDDFEPDVVHANDVTDPAVLEAIAASGRGVQTVQDHRFFCPGRGKVDAEDHPCHDPMGESCSRCFDDDAHGHAMLDLTRRRLLAVARMKRVTVLSRYMADELAAAGVSRQRIVCIPPFVDGLPSGSSGNAATGEFHLMAGRLAEHKGVRSALAAARELRGGLPLVVAGDGPLADAVREEARGNARVRFVDWVDRCGLGDLLSRARSLWLPGIWAEPFGIVGLEALACGVPVIASLAGGVSDWLRDGENGLAVEVGSTTGLAQAADRLARDPSLARALGERGREQVARDFAPESLMRSLRSVHREVMDGVDQRSESISSDWLTTRT
jgi:glycosyltransferase involved in cell wall biosynthesis